jgi:hypothetical protein
METLKEEVCAGAKMVIEKASQIGKAKDKWSLEELGEVADIVKDIASAYKNLAKANWYLSEHSAERF